MTLTQKPRMCIAPELRIANPCGLSAALALGLQGFCSGVSLSASVRVGVSAPCHVTTLVRNEHTKACGEYNKEHSF